MEWKEWNSSFQVSNKTIQFGWDSRSNSVSVYHRLLGGLTTSFFDWFLNPFRYSAPKISPQLFVRLSPFSINSNNKHVSVFKRGIGLSHKDEIGLGHKDDIGCKDEIVKWDERFLHVSPDEIIPRRNFCSNWISVSSELWASAASSTFVSMNLCYFVTCPFLKEPRVLFDNLFQINM